MILKRYIERKINIEKLKVVELFAGVGAWSKALENLKVDHEVVAAVEFDEKTMNGYNLIHGSSFEPSDITKLNENEMPECDIVCYSPPCQAFSIAGKQEGFNDERGILFFDALRIIKSKKPKYALMENVKGLAGKKFKNEFNSMLKELKEAGYINHWKVLNSKDYGVPQNRQRVFIVSVRNDIENDFSFPEAFDNGIRLRDLLDDEVDEKFYISEEIASKLVTKDYKHSEVSSSEINQVGMLEIKGNQQIRRVYNPNGISPTLNTMQGGNRQPKVVEEVLPCLTPHRLNKRQNGRRFKEDNDPSFTVNTQDRHGIAIGNYPKYRIRKLTPKECLNLMGFSNEDYEVLHNNMVSNSQIYKMAGNSIVVNVCEKLFEELFKINYT